MIAEELYDSVQKLEKFTIVEVTTQAVFEVADVVAVAARMGVKVEWIDKTLGEIALRRNQLLCFRKPES